LGSQFKPFWEFGMLQCAQNLLHTSAQGMAMAAIIAWAMDLANFYTVRIILPVFVDQVKSKEKIVGLKGVSAPSLCPRAKVGLTLSKNFISQVHIIVNLFVSMLLGLPSTLSIFFHPWVFRTESISGTSHMHTCRGNWWSMPVLPAYTFMSLGLVIMASSLST